ncbi:hypothetical protein OG905_23585 [Streptomyces sp. NBC_00322]|uniref:hypothetical protein n=1 Tax=Streptomyces sp. NBC_00322 TaxID=2975712 RepID=UPI002E2D1655|nr:hypothetical protein [Streptomyces sp. NBC_00322]
MREMGVGGQAGVSRHELDSGQLMEVSKQISRNRHVYGELVTQLHGAVVADLYTEKGHPEDHETADGGASTFLQFRSGS